MPPATLHSPHVSKNNELAWTHEHHFLILFHIDKVPSQPPLAVAAGAATVDSSAFTKKSLDASVGLMRHGSGKVPSPIYAERWNHPPKSIVLGREAARQASV